MPPGSAFRNARSIHYGRSIAKLEPEFLASLADRPDGKLILVTAISPTPAGEGKTTTTVGLGDALNRIGRKTIICLREPSLGPCFGMKGGAAGGGYAQVVPMDAINLHFTGDFHAITSAHNLLAAMLDNHLYWGNALGLDPRRIAWRRALDMNDRALRETVIGLGGPGNGFPREDGFDITVASEVMAAFCLAAESRGPRARLGRMIVGATRDRRPVTAAELKAEGAMTVLLKDAIKPNLVQTLEGSPALVHGGPFANIAHGCNSVVATRAALKLGDYVVTEAGFGADLGAEKFFDIKCRKAGLKPAAAVVVATVRALKMHGGVAKEALGAENLPALADRPRQSRAPYRQHAQVRRADRGRDQSLQCGHRGGTRFRQAPRSWTSSASRRSSASIGRAAALDAEDLAHAVPALADGGTAQFRPLYPDAMSLWDKTRMIAREIYGADDISADVARAQRRFDDLEAAGWGGLPICVAKTQYSFSDRPALVGAPTRIHVPTVRDVRLRAGAGFVVVLMGDIRTMPGLPRQPRGGAHSHRRRRDRGPVLIAPASVGCASARRRGVLAHQLLGLQRPPEGGGNFGVHHRRVAFGLARALRAGDDADDRGMAERKTQRRFRQLDLERLADLLNAAHPFLHLSGAGP